MQYAAPELRRERSFAMAAVGRSLGGWARDGIEELSCRSEA